MKKILFIVTTILFTSCADDDFFRKVPIKENEQLGKELPTDPQPETPEKSDPIQAEQEFTIQVESRLDILFVIDDSGSMSNNQEKLSLSFNEYLSNIDKKTNIKFAVTTTASQVQTAAFELNHQLYLDNPLLFQTQFKNIIQLPEKRYNPNVERVFKGISDFFEQYPYWARDDAVLSIVTISDESEQSKLSSESIFEKIMNIKKDLNKIHYTAIADFNYDLKNKYQNLVNLTNGHYLNIEKNFGVQLAEIGGYINDRLANYILDSKAKPESIQVFINNKLITDWEYDPITNKIIIKNKSLLKTGEKLVIKYLKG
jgi:hypothetical protein